MATTNMDVRTVAELTTMAKAVAESYDYLYAGVSVRSTRTTPTSITSSVRGPRPAGSSGRLVRATVVRLSVDRCDTGATGATRRARCPLALVPTSAARYASW